LRSIQATSAGGSNNAHANDTVINDFLPVVGLPRHSIDRGHFSSQDLLEMGMNIEGYAFGGFVHFLSQTPVIRA
jgi:hypothetical protein